jgi:hypothetical protein
LASRVCDRFNQCRGANNTRDFPYNKTQSDGFSAIQEALDVLSVKGIVSATLAEPARSSVCVYSEAGKAVLSFYSLFDFPIGMHVEATQINASGKEVKPPLPPEPVWNESFDITDCLNAQMTCLMPTEISFSF